MGNRKSEHSGVLSSLYKVLWRRLLVYFPNLFLDFFRKIITYSMFHINHISVTNMYFDLAKKKKIYTKFYKTLSTLSVQLFFLLHSVSFQLKIVQLFLTSPSSYVTSLSLKIKTTKIRSWALHVWWTTATTGSGLL